MEETGTALGFRVFGDVEARVDGVPVDLGHLRQRGVLGVLLVEADRAVPVDLLVDRVWGGRPPTRGRGTLYSYVSRLRAALSAAARVRIDRGVGGYRLVVDRQAVDLHRFRDLLARARAADRDESAVPLWERALGLWRGDPLVDLDTAWASGLRAALGRERLAAESEHADAALRLGRHAELLPVLADRARRHPLDERIAAQLVLGLYRDGRRADAVEHLRVLRARLATELGTEPGPRLRELHRRVLAADPRLTPPAGAVSTTARPDVPRQLPAPPRSFTGRADELASVSAVLDAATSAGRQATVVVSAVSGAGGIGKTWLVLHWAHRHLDRFPDGQLFVDLRGFSPDRHPMPPGTAIRGFLDALGVHPTRIPTDPDAQAARYRSLVAGRRMLVVLDNAADAEQVLPLLPGSPSCTVLVTSRHRLPALVARCGAHPLRLGVLTDDESRAVLAEALGGAGAREAEVAELTALCGGFPLALGLVAARVRSHLSPAEVAAGLRASGVRALEDAADPGASLPSVLSWSLRRLSGAQRDAVALLGIAPGPDIGLPAAASLVGLPEAAARAVLRVLVDASLLDHRPGGRYAMHDLVRAYATSLAHELPATARSAALHRVVDFYLHTAHAAHCVLAPHTLLVEPEPAAPGTRPLPLPDDPAAMAWLDAEHRHLLAVQHLAAAHHRPYAVWHLAWSLNEFHRRRGHLAHNATTWQAALDTSVDLPDPATRTRTHRNLGRAYVQLGRHPEAVDHLDRSLALAQRQGDVLQQASTLHSLAEAWERRDDRVALRHARAATELYRTLHQPVWEAVALTTVAWCTARLGDHATARELCRSALGVHDHHHNPGGEADLLACLGHIDHHTGRHEQAVRHYRRALVLYRALGHSYELANTLDGIGHPHAALGRPGGAREAWEEAVALYEDQGRQDDADRLRRHLGVLDP
ncbi:BTAD domain-containing putative transcriptional regulator [Actinosynnema sp. NPDC050436]|uniref:AfsR/SARP family transcriptional regulator n=1 Tax=Actinosynnema sp. NPDC050436 TaxID=3155659 RepID=UPI0033E19A78